MFSLVFSVTNACNRRCRHCFINRADPPGFLPLELAADILSQARPLGLQRVHLTGGEPGVYPHLEGLIRLVVDHDLSFTLVTNGHRFRERLLPLLREAAVKPRLEHISFSLDGSFPAIHEALRGEGSFQEVLEGVHLCRSLGLPLNLKSVINNNNLDDLTDLALLGAALQARQHQFICPHPTPALIRGKIMPSPQKLMEVGRWLRTSLAPYVKGEIVIENQPGEVPVFSYCDAWQSPTVDHEGNLFVCCNLCSLSTGEEEPSVFGPERLADLKETPFSEGLKRQFRLWAEIMAARVEEFPRLSGSDHCLCYWCLRRLGKLYWLKEFPDSPWAAAVLAAHGQQGKNASRRGGS
jgi:MoaA/NifB/PqqE/SkfB family radical SAM enzyme|uniref:Radical SAM protein n=1 Tax=Desulfobacca acetoxidans TaxID=60893 RepID=A0A7C3SJX8_9BACT